MKPWGTPAPGEGGANELTASRVGTGCPVTIASQPSWMLLQTQPQASTWSPMA